MALRSTLSKRRFFLRNQSNSILSTVVQSPSPIASPNPANAGVHKIDFQREFLTLSDSSSTGFFRRFLEQRRAINQAAPSKLPEFLSIPVGDKLREKLKSMNIAAGELSRVEGVGLASPSVFPEKEYGRGMSVADVRKILRITQLEKVRLKLKQIPKSSIPYFEYVKICSDACDSKDQGLEFAKMLDSSGTVIVLGNVVFLRPDQVVRSVEKMISESMAIPNDPRKKELEEMEKEKGIIDRKAEIQVKAELYCGLGFLMIQTLGFMRLTFWELSWDVMEPICFFVTSLHFGLAYGFFLKTSKEPSFEGYFQRRFKVKQKKLMKIHNFDIEKYNQLRRAFYPTHSCDHHHGKGLGFDSCLVD